MTLAALSSLSRAAYFGLLAVATSPTLLYIAVGLNSLAGFQGILLRLQPAASPPHLPPSGPAWRRYFPPLSLAPCSP